MVVVYGKWLDCEKGGGFVIIFGNELVELEVIFNLIGVRIGIDGGYWILFVKYRFLKKGFIIDFMLK